MTDFQPIFQAVRQAAELCRVVQEMHLIGGQKIGNEPVTIADYGAQALISRVISRHFPGDAVIAEEQGEQFVELVSDSEKAEIGRLLSDVLGEPVTQADIVRWLDHGQGREAERIWVIDPIDGTRGFVALRNYAIGIGLMVNREPVAGVIGAPGYPTPDRQGVLFHAQSGVAYVQPLNGGALRRIHASERTEPASLRILESVEKSHASHERAEKVHQAAGFTGATLERLDSMEKYARIAAGDADLYLRLPRQFSRRPFAIWDHAAGTVLVQAAGGMVTDVDGGPLDWSRGRALSNKGIIVSNGRIHERVLAAVGKLLAEEGKEF